MPFRRARSAISAGKSEDVVRSVRIGIRVVFVGWVEKDSLRGCHAQSTRQRGLRERKQPGIAKRGLEFVAAQLPERLDCRRRKERKREPEIQRQPWSLIWNQAIERGDQERVIRQTAIG